MITTNKTEIKSVLMRLLGMADTSYNIGIVSAMLLGNIIIYGLFGAGDNKVLYVISILISLVMDLVALNFMMFNNFTKLGVCMLMVTLRVYEVTERAVLISNNIVNIAVMILVLITLCSAYNKLIYRSQNVYWYDWCNVVIASIGIICNERIICDGIAIVAIITAAMVVISILYRADLKRNYGSIQLRVNSGEVYKEYRYVELMWAYITNDELSVCNESFRWDNIQLIMKL